jgi:hypothetical protein
MGESFLLLCIIVFLRLLFVLQFYFIFIPCSVALYFASIFRLFFSGICDSVSFGRSQCCFWLFVVCFEVCPLFSFVVRRFKWCLYLRWWLLFPFSHFLAIAGDYLLITVDVYGEYVDELNFSMVLRQILQHSLCFIFCSCIFAGEHGV